MTIPSEGPAALRRAAAAGRAAAYRAEAELKLIHRAALAVMKRDAYEEIGVADILEEAALNRAFDPTQAAARCPCDPRPRLRDDGVVTGHRPRDRRVLMRRPTACASR